METIKDLADKSWEFAGFYHSLNNNTSKDNLSFGTNDAGFINIPEKEASTIKYDALDIFKFPNETNKLELANIEKFSFKISLEFGKEVENLIIRDLTFRKFILEIEKSLNEFSLYENVRFESKIFFEEDWEISDYKKLTLLLNFKGVSFKQKMSLWKSIINVSYRRIDSLISYSTEELINKFQQLRKDFFVKLEM